MSRICVKNLPKYVGEDRLRDYFSQKGEVTDAKLMRTKDGKSRQFAFVGFRTERDAEEALEFFNNSYMDTCRITCEVARKVGDPNIPRPWSRYSAKKDNPLYGNEDVDEDRPNNLSKGLESSIEKKSKNFEKKDSQFQEFLQVMQPRSKSKIWADDTLTSAQLDHDGKANEEEPPVSKINKRQAGLNKQPADKASSSPTDTESNSMKQTREIASDDAISDMDYFKSKVKKNWSDSETDDEDSHGGIGSGKSLISEVGSKDYTVEKEEAQTDGESDPDETMVQVSLKDSEIEWCRWRGRSLKRSR